MQPVGAPNRRTHWARHGNMNSEALGEHSEAALALGSSEWNSVARWLPGGRKKEPFAGGAGTYEGQKLRVAPRSPLTMFIDEFLRNNPDGGTVEQFLRNCVSCRRDWAYMRHVGRFSKPLLA